MKAHAQRQIFEIAADDWTTPPEVFAALDAEFHFTLDPCCSHENALVERHFTADEDGLRQDWAGDVVYMNPPYGREVGKWMRKAHEESERGATVVCLVPSRTDTAWWHDHAMQADDIRFIRGRLKFGGKRMNSAPFPSAVVVFGPKVAENAANLLPTPLTGGGSMVVEDPTSGPLLPTPRSHESGGQGISTRESGAAMQRKLENEVELLRRSLGESTNPPSEDGKP